MSFGGKPVENLHQFKAFVSQDEIDEKRKKRQEEWEKVRQPEQPLEAPEEAYDPRSLFDQLQEQKDKKQLEFEESHALKNQVATIDEGEAEFLDFVSERQQEITKEREQEEQTVLHEYRNSVQSHIAEEKLQAETARKAGEKKTFGSTVPQKASQGRKSQQSLLAGAVKRKSTDTKSVTETKKHKLTSDQESSSSAKKSGDHTAQPPRSQVAQVSLVLPGLPGLGVYSASSDSDSSDSSDSDINTNLFPTKVQVYSDGHVHSSS